MDQRTLAEDLAVAVPDPRAVAPVTSLGPPHDAQIELSRECRAEADTTPDTAELRLLR